MIRTSFFFIYTLSDEQNQPEDSTGGAQPPSAILSGCLPARPAEGGTEFPAASCSPASSPAWRQCPSSGPSSWAPQSTSSWSLRRFRRTPQDRLSGIRLHVCLLVSLLACIPSRQPKLVPIILPHRGLGEGSERSEPQDIPFRSSHLFCAGSVGFLLVSPVKSRLGGRRPRGAGCVGSVLVAGAWSAWPSASVPIVRLRRHRQKPRPARLFRGRSHRRLWPRRRNPTLRH